MKKLLAIAITFAALNLSAGDWAQSFGIGNQSDGWTFSGKGVALPLITSVQSNSLYYITSAKSSGEPIINSVWFSQDDVTGTIKFYIATNTWTIASNAATISGVSSNILWLTETNAAMATNDLLVVQNVAADSYQLTVVSGNATDARGTVYTNALGQVGIKIFATLTNSPLANDKLFKMAEVKSYTPLAMGCITNQINAVVGDHFQQWLLLGTRQGYPIQFSGPLGKPLMVVMTHSNASKAFLHVDGEYFIRQRR